MKTSFLPSEKVKAAIPEFVALYEQRPFKNNDGGMSAPHLFATWLLTKTLKPKYIIESGVFRGQGTWILKQAAPNAKFTCIDPDQNRIEYKLEDAEYSNVDFSQHNWDDLPKDETLCFFDDHQDSIQRMRLLKKRGFKHAIYEDNYPLCQGDCYSPKQAFMRAQEKHSYPIKKWLHNLFHPNQAFIPPHKEDAHFLEQNLSIYFEFPPVVKTPKTRWNTPWTEEDYPTPKPLYSEGTLPPEASMFIKEAQRYTWICYMQFN